MALIALGLACSGGAEGYTYETDPVTGEMLEIGVARKAYAMPKANANLVRRLGTTPPSTSSQGNLACRRGQATSTDCRFATDSDATNGFYVFVKVGIDEASFTGFDGAGQLAEANTDLDFVINELNNDWATPSPGDGINRYVYSKVPFAQSTIALRKTAIGSVLTGTSQDVYKFMNVSFHGCSSALPEETAFDGTWRACSSAIVNLDVADFFQMSCGSGCGQSSANKRRYVIAAGLLAAQGFGLQGVRNNQKNYTSLTSSSVGQNNYWGPADESVNPTRCVARWSCFGSTSWGIGTFDRCDGKDTPPATKLYSTVISTCSGID